MEDFVEAKFYCLHDLPDGNQHILMALSHVIGSLVFLGVISIQAGTYESQHQLHGDGLLWQYCMQCESQMAFHYHHLDNALT